MLEIRNLSKSYGRNKVLTDINLDIEENKIYGLLGRNGAGKTTLLKLIASQILKDDGEIKLDGEEIFENSKAMEDICLVKDFPNSVKERKVKDILALGKIIYKDWDEEYKNYLIREFNLNIRKKLLKLSTGNKTIVGLIIGLASRSRITIFDEPTIGLDAAMRYKFYNLLLEDYEKNPRTIIISTHLIDEVANLFEEVIILNNKRVMLKNEVNALKEKAYFLSGREDLINPIIKDKKVIHKEEFGSTKIVGIYGDLTEQEINYARNKNIDISNIPLQKLFIYITENILEGESLNEFI
ncbi:ABC-2 type transport system ATP-binding protein [Tissierella praeacuta DSM 18095]|uniref:ABC-2 type transport system ATP-binding protein n=1 Tax=Tissierella praeacuta DSM 18095 TaxID=1123404 RepID=A0A1M4THX9_9FIRM|nr:ABC transporter ATP-binding protein [Tissierella praeacuta]SHE44028.1 ABC-2 type transport system ATP-binding protein [Tissierella praeacuta DSM 18095]SUP04619.1 ABC-type transporter ATP-binding protein EcsA [Tissierella praeacuta]